jgi:hypothetical protein
MEPSDLVTVDFSSALLNSSVAPDPPRSLPEAPAVTPAPLSLEASCAGILREEFERAELRMTPEVGWKLATRIAAAISERRKVDWVSDVDVQNGMKTQIEDVLFSMQDETGIELTFAVIDAVLERCVDKARIVVP